MGATLRVAAGLCTVVAALALASGCEREAPPEPRTADAPNSDTMLPPPIVAPDIAGPAEPPSYEVAIATVAADRNRAKKKCAELPEVERTTCEAKVDADFAAAEADLEPLRGDKQ